MSEDYPQYPELPEEAKDDANKLLATFREEMAKVAEECIGRFYTDVSPHIESDHWTNYQSSIRDWVIGYKGSDYDTKRVRDKIFSENREEIIKDLNADMVKEIKSLKDRIEFQDECLRNRY